MHKSRKAFTIVELLLAAVVGLWVVVIAIVLYIIAQSSWQESVAILEMERTANLAMERLLRGFKTASDSAPRGLLDAKTFTTDIPDRIRFTSGIDSKERSFYLNNDLLMYDPDTSTGGDEIQILTNISNLNFSASVSNPTKVVLINITASKQVRGIDKNVSLSGVARLRND